MIRSLVVAPNWVGDVVMALPVLQALADSGRFVVVLAKPHLAPLLELSPAVGKVILRSSRDRETGESVRRAACHEAIVLPASFRAAWLTWLARVDYRWGYRGQLRSLLLTHPVPSPGGPARPQIEDYSELLETMEIATPDSWVPRIDLDDRRRAEGAMSLERAKIDPTRPVIGFFPGAAFGPSKQWPWRRFAETLDDLGERRPELQPALIVGPSEVWLGVRIHEESGHRVPLIGANLDLGRLAGALSHLDLLVTNDSGPMHLAAALGVPCVAIFGPTDPDRTAPAGEGHTVLAERPWCSPCFRRRCPLLHHRCMRSVAVSDVVATVEQMLPAAPTAV